MPNQESSLDQAFLEEPDEREDLEDKAESPKAEPAKEEQKVDLSASAGRQA